MEEDEIQEADETKLEILRSNAKGELESLIYLPAKVDLDFLVKI
jgi:hypothetical protein